MNDQVLPSAVDESKTSFGPEALNRIAIACQGGGSHAAYVAGALSPLLLRFPEKWSDNGQQLVGLSGTSGGAITALLAWWGLLMGGPERAIERMEIFWQKNSTQRPVEAWWNTVAVSALQLQPCEAQWSPYAPPLREAVIATSQVWPKVANLFGECIRPDFFQMKESISSVLNINANIDFDEVVNAVGKLCSISADVQEWNARSLATTLMVETLSPLPGATAQDLAGVYFSKMVDKTARALDVLKRIKPHLGEIGWLANALDRLGDGFATFLEGESNNSPPVSYPDGDQRVAALERVLAPFINGIPRLILGAVEIDTGNFQAFRSDREPGRGGITLDAVLASAAIPNLFKAVCTTGGDGDDHDYMDGLFSENPPIAPLVVPSGETPVASQFKPDEIWVIQVNPRRCETHSDDPRDHPAVHRHKFDVFDRRNELSGNLSLIQEANFIDAVNRMLEDNIQCAHPRYQKVHIFTIPLDDKAARQKTGRMLDYASKLCRDRRLKDALMEHGKEQARKFIPIRDFVLQCFNEPSAALRNSYFGKQEAARAAHSVTANLGAVRVAVDLLHQAFPKSLHVFIEEVAIGDHPACNCRGNASWDVTLHWRALGIRQEPSGLLCRAALTGKAHFRLAEITYSDGRPSEFLIVDGSLDQVCVDEAEYASQPPSGGPFSPCWEPARPGTSSSVSSTSPLGPTTAPTPAPSEMA